MLNKKNNIQILQAPLSLMIIKEHEKLMHAISLVAETGFRSKKYIGTGGQVSAADIIAYQIGWGKLLISWYEAGIEGTTCAMPGGGFNTWDYTNIALHFYTQYAKLSPEELKQEFEDVMQKIISITEKEYTFGRLEKNGVWTWCTLQSGKEWPLSKWITVNTVAPYKRARTLLKKKKTV